MTPTIIFNNPVFIKLCRSVKELKSESSRSIWHVSIESFNAFFVIDPKIT